MKSLYLSIRDELRSLIADGTYKEKEVLPSEEQFAELYGVSRPTIRRAIDLLVEEGCLERRPRRGVIVRSRKIEQAFATSILSFNDEMYRHGKVPRTKVILGRVVAADESMAKKMGLARGDEVFKLVRLRYADELPNVLVDSLVPVELYPSIGSANFEETSLYDYFHECGNPVTCVRRRLRVERSDAHMATLLDMNEGDPLFLFNTSATDRSGRVVEYSVASYRGASNAFDFTEGLSYA